MTEEELKEMAYELAGMLGDTGREDPTLKEIRRVPILDEKDGLVRRFTTKEAKANATFKYFGKRPLDKEVEEKTKGSKEKKKAKAREAAELNDNVAKSANDLDRKDDI